MLRTTAESLQLRYSHSSAMNNASGQREGSTSTTLTDSLEYRGALIADDVPVRQNATLLAPDILAMAESMSSQLIEAGTDAQLMVLMPLILHQIATEHKANRESDLALPLCERLHYSRRLKLRFLLLRKLPAFSSMILSLRYVARAYDKQPLVNASSAIPRLDIFDVPTPHTFKLPVDMVRTVPVRTGVSVPLCSVSLVLVSRLTCEFVFVCFVFLQSSICKAMISTKISCLKQKKLGIIVSVSS